MAHGFSRFGPPTARERFRAAQKTSVWDRVLPTIVATLVMFALVITLARAFDASIGQPLVRLFAIDEVFPAEELPQRIGPEIWERTGPPTPVVLTDADGAPLPPSAARPPMVGLDAFPLLTPPPLAPVRVEPGLRLPPPAVEPSWEIPGVGPVAP